jgi:hypothetical protein
MKPMTVARMIQMLEGLLRDGDIKPHYQVLVWVKEQGGKRAIALIDGYPDMDSSEEMAAFALEEHHEQ